jgi:predicted RNA-binding Zn-ribbon protein involved in translation (DUF1610 family)
MTYTFECPNCGERIVERAWKDDIHGATVTVETLAECQACGWTYHESYGQVVADSAGDPSKSREVPPS